LVAKSQLRQELIELRREKRRKLRQQVGYWKALHAGPCAGPEWLEAKLAQASAASKARSKVKFSVQERIERRSSPRFRDQSHDG
jgi:hypothetical protein